MMEANQTITLNQLHLNTMGTVQKLNGSGALKRRMLDLGIVKGTQIKPVLQSPLGDPTAYEIRDTLIALREEDANLIEVDVNFPRPF